MIKGVKDTFFYKWTSFFGIFINFLKGQIVTLILYFIWYVTLRPNDSLNCNFGLDDTSTFLPSMVS